MNKKFKDQVFAIIESFRQKEFLGKLVDNLHLPPAEFFGQNEWYTIGIAGFRAELWEKHAVDVREDDLCACKTIEELVEAVVAAKPQPPKQSGKFVDSRLLAQLFPTPG